MVAERLRLVLVLELLADRESDLPRFALAEVSEDPHVESPVAKVSFQSAKRSQNSALFSSKLSLAR